MTYTFQDFDPPAGIPSQDARYSRMVDIGGTLWGLCVQCPEDTSFQFVEAHSHSHECGLNDKDACSWLDPESIQASWLSLQESKLNRHVSDTGLIPPESINDWDSSLYFDDTQVSTKGKRTHRVNGEITYTDKFETLPEVSPKEKPQDTRVFKHRCGYCKKGFNSTFWYVHVHLCDGLIEGKRILASLEKPAESTPVAKVVRVEAALTEHWSEADRNRVPSELGKLDWLNPKQD